MTSVRKSPRGMAYNRQRRHSTLNYETPLAFEAMQIAKQRRPPNMSKFNHCRSAAPISAIGCYIGLLDLQQGLSTLSGQLKIVNGWPL
jgi:hypothetical protein